MEVLRFLGGDFFQMEYDLNRPIYLQIIEKIKYKIINGEIAPGERMASISDMAAEMDVNPNTMFRVYKELEMQGITRGLGSFVVDDKRLVKRLSDEMANEILDFAITGLRKLKFSNSQIIDAVSKKLKK